MKKTSAVVVIVSWLILYSASSFACDLHKELEKRGFSPERVGKGISEHFGGNLKVSADVTGKPFFFKNGHAFNLAIAQNGKISRVKEVENLRGVSFTGTINDNPVEIFVAEKVEFVGIKTNGKALTQKPVRNVSLASRSFEPIPVSARQTNFMPALARQTVVATPAQQRVEPTEVTSTHVVADQIIYAGMEDSSTLMSPMNQQVQVAKEKASLTDQQVKRVTAKKKARNQKYVDAGVTTSAIVSGLAIPGVGPIIAGAIIIGRVGWGLFQNDSDE